MHREDGALLIRLYTRGGNAMHSLSYSSVREESPRLRDAEFVGSEPTDTVKKLRRAGLPPKMKNPDEIPSRRVT